MRIYHQGRRSVNGTVTLEMAVVLPILVLLIVVGVDFARIYYYELTLTNAARNGAVFAGAHPDNSVNSAEIENVALKDTTNLTPNPTVSSVVTKDASENEYVTVTVKWGFNTVVDYPGIPRPFILERSVKMRVAPANPKENSVP